MNEIHDLNTALMDRAERELLSSIDDVEEEVWRIVRKILREFQTKDGFFVPDDASTQVINSLRKELRDLLKRTSLPDRMDDFFHHFDEIGDNVAAIHKELNNIRVPKSLINRQKKFAVENTVFSMLDSNVSLKFVDPVKRSLFNHINFGSGVLDAENELRTMILGQGEDLGILRRWVGQVARDSIQQYEGGINQRVAVEYELDGFRYVGSLVEDSRPQCVRWMNMGVISKKDLADEINWAKRNGSGMISATTPETFAVYRGGYNCRHTAYPTRIDDE